MSKINDETLLIPGDTGWEIWTRPGTGDFTLHSATLESRTGDLADLPAGDILLCFPVKAVTALPMKVASDDDSLFEDLATLHAERLGLRPDPMAGQLTDLLVIERHAESATLLEILLRSPREGDLPVRGPKAFDISPRAIDATGHQCAVWREFGRWVFAIHRDGKLFYCQATANNSLAPDPALAREIRLALIQLEIQGLTTQIPSTVVWTDNPDLDVREFASTLKTEVTLTPRPTPAWPDPPSRLLPADVRAARRVAARQRTIILASATAAAIYIGLIGWLAFGFFSDKSAAKKLRAVADAAAPEGLAVARHNEKWDELAIALYLNHDPIDILTRVHRSIPPNSGLRLRTAEISADQVKLIGEAPQAPPVQQFNLALNRNNELAFSWQNPEPSQSNRGWEFVFTGTITQP